MPIITLTSDYGTLDYRVAAVKGQILSLNQSANIVDITHEISSYDLLQTSYIVKNAYKYYPKGSVHVICVDSFHSKFVKHVLYKADGHYFIAADNGVLSLILSDVRPESIHEITLHNRFDDNINFLAIDVFAHAAVHLMNGGIPDVIGRKLTTPKKLSYPKAVYNETERMILGEVIYIDKFENVVTNITKKFFKKIHSNFPEQVVKFRNLKLHRIYNKYSDIVTDSEQESLMHGTAAVIFNEADFMEILIYKGLENNGARNLMGLKVGEKIYIEFF